jgi:peptidoglycan/xylan/chitin deacetylase (PgdA/CDA1 family)
MQIIVIILLFSIGVTLCANETKLLASVGGFQGKQIAITIDDLPLNGPDIDLARTRRMTAKILSILKRNSVPAVGFVNEGLVNTPGEVRARTALLKDWLKAGVELGNHTFSHLSFKDSTLSAYEDDFLRGEPLIRKLMKKKGQRVRYFRHPFLQMGTTREIESSFEDFISKRGYKMAPVTIDELDWMFMYAYLHARNHANSRKLKQVSAEFLKYFSDKLDHCEMVSADLFGRQPTQILLMHANELMADNLDGLLKMLKSREYRFVSLEAALADPIYKSPDKYSDTADWLSGWAASKGKHYTAPQPPETIQKEYQADQK